MTLQQLGQLVKAQYPQYQKYSDEDIGGRVASKYPQYAKLITQDTGGVSFDESAVPMTSKPVSGESLGFGTPGMQTLQTAPKQEPQVTQPTPVTTEEPVDPKVQAFVKSMSPYVKSVSDATSLFNMTQPAKETSAAEKRKMALGQIGSVISDLAKYSVTAPAGMTGATKALLGKIPGVAGGPAEMLSRDTEGYARLIASGLASEVGVATDRDVNRWKRLMPQPGDTMEERMDRLNSLVNRIKAESKVYGVESQLLTIQDPKTGDLFEADDIEEYFKMIKSGYTAY